MYRSVQVFPSTYSMLNSDSLQSRLKSNSLLSMPKTKTLFTQDSLPHAILPPPRTRHPQKHSPLGLALASFLFYGSFPVLRNTHCSTILQYLYWKRRILMLSHVSWKLLKLVTSQYFFRYSFLNHFLRYNYVSKQVNAITLNLLNPEKHLTRLLCQNVFDETRSISSVLQIQSLQKNFS